MIIDAHNHVGGPDKGDGASQTQEKIISRMDEVGVDKAVIFPFNEIHLGISFSLANDYIAAAVKKYSNRLIGFARLDPNFGEKSVIELERAVKVLGLRGIKLHPSSQQFSVDNPWVFKIIEKAAELGVPVVFDSGKDPSPPEKIGNLARTVQDAIIIMAHMRGEKYLETAEKFENIYLGTTGMFDQDKLEEAVERLGAEKIIAGSDSPYHEMGDEIKKFDFARENEKTLILGENIRKILNL